MTRARTRRRADRHTARRTAQHRAPHRRERLRRQHQHRPTTGEPRRQPLAQQLEATVQTHAHRASRHADCRRDLRRTFAAQQMALERRAVGFGDALQRGQQTALQFGGFRQLRRIGFASRRCQSLGVGRPGAATQVAHPIDQQTEQPRQQRPRRIPRLPRLDRHQERALHGILDGVPIAAQVGGDLPEFGCRAVEDPRQQARVAVAAVPVEPAVFTSSDHVGYWRGRREASPESPESASPSLRHRGQDATDLGLSLSHDRRPRHVSQRYGTRNRGARHRRVA